ncbi:Component of a membrane-bound complex containing the Tor2p kinase [Saxophila tyrrhenica]|uniref:Component of a membrane-bound complex containing the Tor2p kinase n=1 Tax=Saxophila tyrrhenica TaxID=1690608 RepID=A0AAV9PNC9_9PEZI|nr:Component of a membrane-bound complex containing the Tor2p kinase [Saxophila tyrrhenica]
MSLLLNEDFTTYQLRLSFLNNHRHVGDGVGERLINLPTGVLNNPAFRAAGWLPDTQAVKRCYSPPIPTTGAAGADAGSYFRAPTRTRGISIEEDRPVRESEDAGGMVTGRAGSEDTIPAGTLMAANDRKRRQRTRREMLEEEDSSDLDSDDSEDDEKSAARGISFAKMPVRDRSKSSPANPLEADEGADGPALMITSPSRPPEVVAEALRRGSLGQVEAIKQRARRDTTTSSEMSSDSEALDPNAFGRKLPGRPGGQRRVHLAERIQEEEDLPRRPAEEDEAGESELEDSDVGEASDLSDEFDVDAGTADSASLLGLGVVGGQGIGSETSPMKALPDMPPAVPAEPRHSVAGKSATDDAMTPLPKLPPGHRLTAVVPPSLITMALRGNSPGQSTDKPFQRFAEWSGKDESSPLWIKIYAPFSSTPSKALQVPIRRQREGEKATVTDLIGLSLWRYNEEGYKPPVGDKGDEEANINRWTLRIVEDEEIDFDFPALVRTRPVTDFTSNNNRPPQRRARDKPWDEFGLVRATDEQFKENEALTPSIGTSTMGTPNLTAAPTPRPSEPELQVCPATAVRSETETSVQTTRSTTPALQAPRHPITGPSFASSALRKETGNALDLPQRDEAQSTPRTGAPKTITVHFTDQNTFASTTVPIQTTADTYIAEIFAEGCHKLNLEKALYVLKVHGTQTVAPSDRTVEALGDKLSLDLVRRRFIGAGAGDGMFGLGLSGSPGSTSPNAPLELNNITTPGGGNAAGGGKKHKKGTGAGYTNPNAQLTNASNLNLGLGRGLGLDIGGKRYNVLRKQPLSFAPSHPRTLIITAEYLTILPAAPPGTPGVMGAAGAGGGKVTNVPMSSIVGVKVSGRHPKMVRVLVFRAAAGGAGAQETKRYDFECDSGNVATEIVSEVRKALEGLERMNG